MIRASIALLFTSTLALGGCASLGGNVKGNFSCNAPDGICAPSATIDDQALATIASGESDSARPGRPGLVSAYGARPRSSDALRIVLPARADRFGRWREESVVYAERLASAEPRQAQGRAALDTGSGTTSLTLTELALSAPRSGSALAGKNGGRPVSRRALAEEVAARLRQAGPGANAAPVAAEAETSPAPTSPAVPLSDAPVAAPAFPASSAAREGEP